MTEEGIGGPVVIFPDELGSWVTQAAQEMSKYLYVKGRLPAEIVRVIGNPMTKKYRITLRVEEDKS